jgi:hypothetical protein
MFYGTGHWRCIHNTSFSFSILFDVSCNRPILWGLAFVKKIQFAFAQRKNKFMLFNTYKLLIMKQNTLNVKKTIGISKLPVTKRHIWWLNFESVLNCSIFLQNGKIDINGCRRLLFNCIDV